MFVLPEKLGAEGAAIPEMSQEEIPATSENAFAYTYHGDVSEAHKQTFEARMEDTRAFYALAGMSLPRAKSPSHGESTASRRPYMSCADLPRPKVYARSSINSS